MLDKDCEFLNLLVRGLLTCSSYKPYYLYCSKILSLKTQCELNSVLLPGLYVYIYLVYIGFPGGSDDNSEDPGLIPGSERSSGKGNGNPLEYSCLENPMERGAWQLQSVGSQRVRQD